MLGNGAFRFAFTNPAAATFTVLATTNISVPASNWTLLGTLTTSGSGIYEFTDTNAVIYPRRFYQLRQP